MSDALDNELNMYGCKPCPKCGSLYRWPTQKNHPTKPNTTLCDDCGYEETNDTLEKDE